MARYQQLFSDAERQQALADTLSQRAMQSRGPQQTGRQAPAMHVGEGFAQLGEALLARRAGKKASATTQAAEDARRKAQAAALAGMTSNGMPEDGMGPPAPVNPYANAQSALEAGVDPRVAQAYLQQQFPDQADGANSASLAGYRQAKAEGFEGTYLDYKREFEGREANAPMSVQEWNVFSQLSPEEQQQYLEMKRNVPIETINQVPTRVMAGGAQQPLSTLASEANAAGEVNRARAEGTESGQARGTAVANLPVIQHTTRLALDTVEKMLQHPGMGTATGLSGTLDPRNYIPGTDARNFQALKNQAQGQVFLDAFQAMKGGGTVTEIEGLKAEQAKARMDTAQSDEEFRTALNDYANALRRGLRLAEQRAGMVTGGGFGGEDIPTTQLPNRAPPGAVSWDKL